MPEENAPPQMFENTALDKKLEALLFATGGSVPKATLSRVLVVDKEALQHATDTLKMRLKDSGLSLIETDSAIALSTSPETSEVVAGAGRKEFAEDLGDAGLEVLAIVLYRGSATRATIDYIRGVNSAATIRTLTMRGLIERDGKRVGEGSGFRATVECLAHLGVTHVSDLPNYEETVKELQEFEESAEKETE